MSPVGSKIDFKGDLIFESTAWFFVVILKFIFTLIYEIKIFEKKFLLTKIISLKLRYLLELLFLYKKKMNTSEEKLKNTKSLQIRFVIVSPISQAISKRLWKINVLVIKLFLYKIKIMIITELGKKFLNITWCQSWITWAVKRKKSSGILSSETST